MTTLRWGLEICHMYADSFVFEQKIYCSFFLLMDGVGHNTWGGQSWSFTMAVINIWPKNVLKLQPIQSLEVVASLTSSHKPDKFYQRREHPTPSPSPTHSSAHSTDDQTPVIFTFNFLCEKNVLAYWI